MAARKLLAQALELSHEERAWIARELIGSLDERAPEDPGEIAKAWGEEIARRVHELKSGKVKAVPWSTVKREVDRTLRAVRARKRRTRAK